MKVYDCFTFLNEFDVLRLRLAELAAHVDYFVLVEAPYTFSGLPKPLHYRNNPISGYKIKHVVVDDFEFPDLTREQASNREAKGFVNEWHQRDAGFRTGTADADATDIVLASDADEIARPSKILEGPLDIPVCLEQEWYNYWLNCRINLHEPWYGTGRGPASFVQDEYMGGQALFYGRAGPDCPHITNAGWHYSFTGGRQAIKEKLLSFSHVQFQHLATDEHIDNCLDNVVDVCNGLLGSRPYRIVDVDGTFPLTVQENKDGQWDHLLKR